MKTQTGYIYPEGISAERKPLKSPFYRYHSITLWRNKALKEWEKTPIPLKWNTKIVRTEGSNVVLIGWRLKGWSMNHYEYVTPGTKVQHNQGEVTRILCDTK